MNLRSIVDTMCELFKDSYWVNPALKTPIYLIDDAFDEFYQSFVCAEQVKEVQPFLLILRKVQSLEFSISQLLLHLEGDKYWTNNLRFASFLYCVASHCSVDGWELRLEDLGTKLLQIDSLMFLRFSNEFFI
jgi:hypothetical protein